MKKGLFSVVFASAMLGATTFAFAGAYGEAEQAEEIPAPLPAAVPTPEPPTPRAMHKFAGFLTDAETTHGLWVELDSMYGIHYYDHSGDFESVNTDLHISYGKDLFEVGALMPYLFVNQEHITGDDANAFGDLRLWGKVMPVRTDMFTFGGGLIATFPTAGHDNGTHFGTNAYGFEPFLTVGVLAGPVSIRYHAGYYVTTDPDTHRFDNLPSSDADDVFDAFDENLGVLMPIGDMVVARAEIQHEHLTSEAVGSGDNDPTSIIPGADIYIGVGGDNELVIRPTVGVGLCDNAPNWQAGLGIAFSANGI